MNKLLNLLLVSAFGMSAVFIAACTFGQSRTVNGSQVVNDSQAVIVEDEVTGTADEADSEAQSRAKTIKVTVSSSGFAPEQVRVKKGQPVRLAFYRKDADNCGGEVVFPKLNIKRALPVGKTVTVRVTPANTGELGFTCGMNMMRGKIVVTD
ncbi:MAG: cupredoxin domain-containing protein [Pyrinomonadaceae bacterium]